MRHTQEQVTLSEIEAEFAVKTKRPNETEGYQVLASSGYTLTNENFDAILQQLHTGDLPPIDRTSGLPTVPHDAVRLAVGPYTPRGWTENPYICVIHYEWTDRFDIAGRQASVRSCVCIPYDAIASKRISFADLAAQLQRYNFEQLLEMRGMLPLMLPQSPNSRLKRFETLIEGVGFRFAAYVAAALVEGSKKVILWRGKQIPVEQRLEYLDAIAALLPYGYRANLAMSTWLVSPPSHKIRFGFSDWGGHDTRTINWGEPPPQKPEPRSNTHECRRA